MLSIQQRNILLVMVFTGIINSYILRSCVHLALTEMVVKQETSGGRDCTSSKSIDINPNGPRFEWTQRHQAAILVSFLIGYVLSHTTGHILLDKFEGHYILALGVLTSAAMTAIIPQVIIYSNWYVFCGIRLIVGMAQGPLFAGVAHIFSKWIPKQEHRKASLLAYLGPHIGNIVAYIGTGILMSSTTCWEVVYYVWGGLATFWFLLFAILCRSNPANHPLITPEEKLLLVNQTESRPRLKVSRKKMLCDWKTLGIISGWIGHSLVYFFVNISLPKYLKEVIKVNVLENGIMNSVFYACAMISIFISISAGEKSMPRDDSALNTRRCLLIFGNLAPCVCLLLAGYLECDRYKVGFLIALSGLVMGPSYFAVRSSIYDLTHNFGAAATVLVNGFGTLSYIPVPNAIAYIASTNSRQEWLIISLTLFGVTGLTTMISVWKSTRQRADWD
ncbi:putative inorganic phosphate cotransporter [Photinus pyralis]|nr:putative inorganic phosphate cotransporter [Photinus pyralis]